MNKYDALFDSNKSTLELRLDLFSIGEKIPAEDKDDFFEAYWRAHMIAADREHELAMARHYMM